MVSYEMLRCQKCGKPTHIELIDAKPNDPENPETCDWEILQCQGCYGPGWCSMSGDPERDRKCQELQDKARRG